MNVSQFKLRTRSRGATCLEPRAGPNTSGALSRWVDGGSGRPVSLVVVRFQNGQLRLVSLSLNEPLGNYWGRRLEPSVGSFGCTATASRTLQADDAKQNTVLIDNDWQLIFFHKLLSFRQGFFPLEQ